MEEVGGLLVLGREVIGGVSGFEGTVFFVFGGLDGAVFFVATVMPVVVESVIVVF